MAAGPPKRGRGCKSCDNLDSCIFSGLGEEGLSQVTKMLRQTPHARSEIIFHQGTPIFGYYILCRGKAKLVRRTTSGKKQLFQFYSAGDLIGGLLLHHAEVHSSYVRTLENSVVGFLNKADFADLLRRYPQVSLEVICRLSQELEMLRRRLLAVSYKGVRERLIGLLLELGKEYGDREEEGGLLIDLKLTEEELGELIGSTRQTVSQHLGKLAKKGLISVERHKVLIIDEEVLKNLR